MLQINTNIDVSMMNEVRFEDRVRPEQKKKGSLGTERYEVYIRNEEDIKLFCNFITDKV